MQIMHYGFFYCQLNNDITEKYNVLKQSLTLPINYKFPVKLKRLGTDIANKLLSVMVSLFGKSTW